jgi:NAD(P)-dependent dehydrogenase (short-subunit alcohol dehydrogenase family)
MRAISVDRLFDFTNKIVLVTGGSRGLGLAMVRGFAERGADVVIASRKLANCEAAAEEMRALGRRALAVSCHAGNWASLDTLVERAYAEFGRVDVLINNAGMSPVSPSSFETSEELIDKVFAINFKGPFRLSAAIGRRMAAGDGGSIINISSIGAIRPLPEYAPYAGAKAALNALTTAHAAEFAPHVRVNAILPGSFRTDIAKHWPADKEAKTNAAAGRFGEPDEIVTTALYLASSASGFTTGAMIRVDGGRP